MGTVNVIAKVFADNPDDFDSIKAEIAKLGELARADVEDVGFGAKVLRIMMRMPDSEGGDIETKIKEIKGVSNVQVEEVALL